MHDILWRNNHKSGYTKLYADYFWYSFGSVQHAMMTRVMNARAWREVLQTQIGMALHRRLGTASPMRVIPADMAEMISNFL
jgi:hypothetical protein